MSLYMQAVFAFTMGIKATLTKSEWEKTKNIVLLILKSMGQEAYAEGRGFDSMTQEEEEAVRRLPSGELHPADRIIHFVCSQGSFSFGGGARRPAEYPPPLDKDTFNDELPLLMQFIRIS